MNEKQGTQELDNIFKYNTAALVEVINKDQI